MIEDAVPTRDQRGAAAVEYSVVTVAAASLAGMIAVGVPSPLGEAIGKLMLWMAEQFMSILGG